MVVLETFPPSLYQRGLTDYQRVHFQKQWQARQGLRVVAISSQEPRLLALCFELEPRFLDSFEICPADGVQFEEFERIFV
jgi:hypothetical protein